MCAKAKMPVPRHERGNAVRNKFLLPVVLLLASVTAHSEDPVAALGKQRAVASHLEWDIGEAGHPILGPIRFAHTKASIATPVGTANVYSNAYVSCEKSTGTIAIELTNQITPDDPGGLPPKRMPRLVCISPAGTSGGTVVQQVLAASWQVNDLGDALAHGFLPSALRACSAIGIVEDVVMPEGWAPGSLPIQFEISPYSRELDSIFATCGVASAYASPSPVAARSAPSQSGEGRPNSWKTARTIASGRTNVRAAPNLHSPVVAELNPGSVVLVQSTGGPWWRARSRAGAKFEGYIRGDRLVGK
jgi:hypothetical protein